MCRAGTAERYVNQSVISCIISCSYHQSPIKQAFYLSNATRSFPTFRERVTKAQEQHALYLRFRQRGVSEKEINL